MLRAGFRGYRWVSAEKSPTEVMGLERVKTVAWIYGFEKCRIIWFSWCVALPLNSLPKGVFWPLGLYCCYYKIIRMASGILWPQTANSETDLQHNLDVSTSQRLFPIDCLHAATIYWQGRGFHSMGTDSASRRSWSSRMVQDVAVGSRNLCPTDMITRYLCCTDYFRELN